MNDLTKGNRTMAKKILAILTIVVLCCLAVSAVSEEGSWTCPNCGRTGNTGNFCGNCASARPGGDWTCPNCGRTGNTGNFCTNCAAARPSAVQPVEVTAAPVVVNDQLEQIPGETSHVKVKLRSVSGDPYIANSEQMSRWAPQNAADGDETTCWQFSSGGKQTLSKNWLALTLNSPQTVDALWFKNGFWGYSTTGKDQYPLNARPKGIQVDFMYQGGTDYTDTISLTLQDDKEHKGWQCHEVGRHDQVTSVRIRIITYYSGSQVPNDVSLSEVMLVQNASASTATAAQATNPPTYYEAPKATGNTGSQGNQANLLDRLSTRSGPSTAYEEPGTFFQNNWQEKTVRVMGKEFHNGVWWVEVDFEWKNNTRLRVWTGAKRVDIDLNQVNETRAIGVCSLGPCDAWYGPGGSYYKAKEKVLFPEDGVEIYGQENGYVQVDFYDVNREFQRRIWVPENAVSRVRWY